MNCIIVDDEPLAREAIHILVEKTFNLNLLQTFNGAESAGMFLKNNPNTVDLVFLDIQMPGTNGIEFSNSIPKETLVIFTTAFSEFAADSYEVDAVDYLIKPVRLERFQKAVEKARSYSELIKIKNDPPNIETATDDYLFVKAERKMFKLYFKNILFIQGLKDYVIIHTENQKIITAVSIKAIQGQLPKDSFVRVSKSYIVNSKCIDSLDNNTIYIGMNEIPIGNIYRDYFFNEFVTKKILGK
ncbi:LytR/AlgR family response regulator transcription factor [Chryseobacterium sp. JV274]|uniref:LytR/AlgR family response regulator transcription factor n=1 Tax=Chryseobacterium sp. JV274 TaxID=1932669 RepID=UPI0015C2A312|nr:LytTR family DNA-binding domain-containing protein [Chryseobacterium sp. JV274]CAD0218267.1 Transcriptional regulator [Chryseobacterium sp. JV274]